MGMAHIIYKNKSSASQVKNMSEILIKIRLYIDDNAKV